MLKIDWCSSQTIDFEGESDTYIECYPVAEDRVRYSAIYKLLFDRHKYIQVQGVLK